MSKIQNILSASLLAAPILTGTAAHAQSPDDLATELSLPMDKAAYYFNRATNTGFIEKCEAKDGAIDCRMKVLGQTALVTYVQTSQYNKTGGNVTVTAQSPQQSRNWGSEESQSFFKVAKQAPIYTLAADSKLIDTAKNRTGDLVQNEVGVITKQGDDSASLCSTTPIGPKRTIEVCMTFNAGGGSVLHTALPKMLSGGNAVVPQGRFDVSRSFDFNTDDVRYNNEWLAAAKDGPAYIRRSPAP